MTRRFARSLFPLAAPPRVAAAERPTTARRLEPSPTRRAAVLAAALALIAALAPAGLVTADAACRVVDDAAPTLSYASLQDAVDAATSGATLRVSGTCVGTTAIATSLSIVGQGHATLDGDYAGSVLRIHNPTGIAPMALVGLTITHGQAPFGGGVQNMGNLTIVDSTIVANTATAGGGGIASDHGTLTLVDSQVHRNTAPVGGGIGNTTNELHLYGTSSVDSNSASASGGGIANGDGSTYLHDASSVHHNTAGGDGGGVSTNFGRLLLFDNSSIDHNSAGGNGGGAHSGLNGLLALADASSIAHNRAGGDGGGIWVSNDAAPPTNAVPGVNVLHNHPNDVFIEP